MTPSQKSPPPSAFPHPILDFLPYSDVRSTITSYRSIAHDASSQIKTISVHRAAEMDVPSAQRFTHAEEINIAAADLVLGRRGFSNSSISDGLPEAATMLRRWAETDLYPLPRLEPTEGVQRDGDQRRSGQPRRTFPGDYHGIFGRLPKSAAVQHHRSVRRSWPGSI